MLLTKRCLSLGLQHLLHAYSNPVFDIPSDSSIFNNQTKSLNFPFAIHVSCRCCCTTVRLPAPSNLCIFGTPPDTCCKISSLLIRHSKPVPIGCQPSNIISKRRLSRLKKPPTFHRFRMSFLV